MNKPAKIRRSPAYEKDGYGWALAQAELLRTKKFDEIDWENIAEEIESVGKSEYRWVESSLRVLMVHLLKWDHQPGFRSRSWFGTIREQSRQFQRGLRENPSLKPRLEEIRSEAYRQALAETAAETGLAADSFPADPPGWNLINNPPVREEDIPER